MDLGIEVILELFSSDSFKNIFDWISRIEKIVWYNKPMFLMATSEGIKGASSVLQMAYNRMSIGNPNQIPYFSLPNFSDNFDQQTGIKNKDLSKKFINSLSIFAFSRASSSF